MRYYIADLHFNHDLSKEHTIEMDEFLGKSKETEKKDDKPD